MSVASPWFARVPETAGGEALERWPLHHPDLDYRCLLESQPQYFVPPRLLGGVTKPGPLIVNPRAWFSWRGTPPPPEVRNNLSLTARLSAAQDTVWVPQPRHGSWTPFQLGQELRALLDHASSGGAWRGDSSSTLVQVLSLAAILINEEAFAAEARTGAAQIAEAHSRFLHRGYAPLQGLIHPFHLGELRRYLRAASRAGRFRMGDGQSARRSVSHNDRVLRFFHHQLTPLVGALVGERVKPSYVYGAIYHSDAELPPHTDRPQCEFSVTLLADYAPEPTCEAPWPLALSSEHGEVRCFQAIGDGLLYRGRTLRHWRSRIPPGATSASVFFHYVRESFDGALD
ncbi:hypothetical protein WA016_04183 [Myxococcus stipitatus]